MPVGSSRFWQIGLFRLWVTRLPRAWKLEYERTADPFQETLVVAGNPETQPGEEAQTLRVGFRTTDEPVELRPVPPDRPLLVDPATPFFLAPGEETRLFISIPLWIAVLSGKASTKLLDVPLFQPSDTWFGPSTLEGELCYASRTSARLELENLPLLPQRAITAVDIRNQAPTPLSLERVRLPAPNLRLFETDDHLLWTESITVHRDEDGGSARLSLGKTPPSDLVRGRLLTDPREEAKAGLLMRTFGGLLRPDTGRADE
jgi:hypothetical protein